MYRIINFIRTKWLEILVMGILFPCLIAILFIHPFIGGLFVVIIFFAVFLVHMFDTYKQKKNPIVGKGETAGIPKKGLLFTVGFQGSTIEFAIALQEHVEYFGFICSKDTEDIAQNIVLKKNIDEDRYRLKTVDLQDLNEIRLETQVIVDWMMKKGLHISVQELEQNMKHLEQKD